MARAFDWQSKGHRFDSDILHLKIRGLQMKFVALFSLYKHSTNKSVDSPLYMVGFVLSFKAFSLSHPSFCVRYQKVYHFYWETNEKSSTYLTWFEISCCGKDKRDTGILVSVSFYSMQFCVIDFQLFMIFIEELSSFSITNPLDFSMGMKKIWNPHG